MGGWGDKRANEGIFVLKWHPTLSAKNTKCENFPLYMYGVYILNLLSLIHLHSRTSVADDHVEEHKLLGQDSGGVKSLSLDSVEMNEEVGGNNEEIIAHLRECIKTERDQKVTN